MRFQFGARLVGLARHWRQLLDRHLVEAGLTDATWAPLTHLSRAGGWLHQKDLALRAGLDASSLVRLLDILERQALVRRQTDPADRRAKQIQLTDLGRARVAEIDAILGPIEERLLQDLDERALDELSGWFAKIEARIAADDHKTKAVD
ncbi:MarR family winged helix-turn-helix transcriptional regulator [Rhizobium halophytocola]|uniref:MarR family transcriptional regulator for hemolysin n=1 Tax=Rhizobium halophytocola TaxID=735519 RepID=A0ABS4DTK7_9HYPH|nr:MarR family transcriptional regulator [Rhizobium halophytocola]MBP1849030.1 MarR family transcriptional regulator for hemolysin [Rhizobium halophytocola]